MTALAGFTFDHVSLAVHDADRCARLLRSEMGSTPISGEQLPDFRYVLNRMGTHDAGMQVEFIEPRGNEGFVRRFLAERGEGVHHLTFTVPDLPDALARIQALGIDIIQLRLDHPPWREFFIHPREEGLGVLIQIADTDRPYPAMRRLLERPIDDPATLPHNKEGVDRLWWASIRNEVPAPACTLKRIEMDTTHPSIVHSLFTDVLGAQNHSAPGTDVRDYQWPGSILRVKTAKTSGVTGLVFEGFRTETLTLGSATFTPMTTETR